MKALITFLLISLSCSPVTVPGVDITTEDTLSITETISDTITLDVDTGDLSDGEKFPSLLINQIQVIGTHNSYHIEPDPLPVAQYAYTHLPLDEQLQDHAVRQVELDIHLDKSGEFQVYHVFYFDQQTTCATLPECLSVIRQWSDAHPDHELLYILIEPKDSLEVIKTHDYWVELEEVVYALWPKELLVRPDDVRGAFDSLREALESTGWPTVEDTQGKTMFIMLNDSAQTELYLDGHPTLEDRLFFIRGGATQPYGAIIEHGNPIGSFYSIQEMVKAGYLVRTSTPNVDHDDEEKAEACQKALDSGAHIISTDYPYEVEGEYWFQLPGGATVRCNPLTAPAWCQ